MIFYQLFVRSDKPLKEIGQSLEIVRASFMLVRLHNWVVFLYEVLCYDTLYFQEHLRVLIAISSISMKISNY